MYIPSLHWCKIKKVHTLITVIERSGKNTFFKVMKILRKGIHISVHYAGKVKEMHCLL